MVHLHLEVDEATRDKFKALAEKRGIAMQYLGADAIKKYIQIEEMLAISKTGEVNTLSVDLEKKFPSIHEDLHA